MKLKPYPKYKNTGVEWLNVVPDEWTLTKVKHVTSFTTGWTPPTGDSESFEGNNLWANISDLGPKILNDTAKRVSDEAIKRSNIAISPKGSLLFSFKLSIGQVGFSGCNLYTNEAIATFLPNQAASLDYLFYASPIYIVENTSFNIYGAKLLNQQLINSAFIALPNQSEQKLISNFLDRETIKLDILISKQEHLIELLQEKRQSIISHAVTKGLNPDAKMKDSGLDWLGAVPSHWKITRLKYLGDAIIGLTYDPLEVVDEGEGTLILRSSNIQQGAACFEDNVFVKKDIPEKLKTKVGDILICSRNGSRKLIGKNITIDENTKNLSFGAFMTIFRTKYYKYISCVLNSSLFKFQAGSFLTSTVNQLTTGNLNSFEVPLPPEEEQIKIAEYINIQTNKIDTLIDKAKRSIDLAREHRTALISAAVTGKIDVRN